MAWKKPSEELTILSEERKAETPPLSLNVDNNPVLTITLF